MENKKTSADQQQQHSVKMLLEMVSEVFIFTRTLVLYHHNLKWCKKETTQPVSPRVIDGIMKNENCGNTEAKSQMTRQEFKVWSQTSRSKAQ